MSIKYGPGSRKQIDTLHPTLARVLYDYADIAPPELDISIVCGFRGQIDQDKAFAEGKSKLKWPHSGHNKQPSRAVDFAPYIGGKLEWNDKNEFLLRQGALRLVAAQRGIRLKPLIDWDLPHLELADPE